MTFQVHRLYSLCYQKLPLMFKIQAILLPRNHKHGHIIHTSSKKSIYFSLRSEFKIFFPSLLVRILYIMFTVILGTYGTCHINSMYVYFTQNLIRVSLFSDGMVVKCNFTVTSRRRIAKISP